MSRSPWQPSWFDLKPAERVLAVLSLLLFLGSFTLYVTEFPLRYYLFGVPVENGAKVGRVKIAQGDLRRQLLGESEFLKAAGNTSLYAEDTIVTGTDSSAVLELEGYGDINLGPETMVKLTFENSYSLGGVERAPSIEVVTGDVTGVPKENSIVLRPKAGKVITVKRGAPAKLKVHEQVVVEAAPEATPVTEAEVIAKSKPPAPPESKPAPVAKVEPVAVPSAVAVAKPSPSPVAAVVAEAEPEPSVTPSPSPSVVVAAQKIQLIFPAPGQRLELDPNSGKFQKEITFFWRLPGWDKPTELTLYKLREGKKKALIAKAKFNLSAGIGKHTWSVKEPGKYEWEIRNEDGEVISEKQPWHQEFSVDPTVIGLKLKDPLVGGEKADSNAFHGKILNSFDISLEWEAVPDTESYVLQVFKDDKGGKPIVQKTLSEPKYELNKNKVYSGSVYYQVSSHLKSGFVVTSPMTHFTFGFLAPAQVRPIDDAVVEVNPRRPEQADVIFTWQKTNFTVAYDFEVAKDPDFKDFVVQSKVTTNFGIMKAAKDGTYYWRIRAHSATLTSPFSKVARFSVKRVLSKVNKPPTVQSITSP